MSAEDVRAELAELLAGHHCRMHKKGPIECWSTLDDQECGLRFTTGGQYRAHVAEVLAQYVATKQAEALREFARDQRDRMARAWGGNAGWMTTGTGVADVVCDWINEEADDIADRIAP